MQPPSDNWLVRSVVNGKKHISMRDAPVLFVAHTNKERGFHEGSTSPAKNIGDRHRFLPEFSHKLAGAIVSRPVTGVAKDFPMLQVVDPIKAIMELGFAARQRYEGPVIAVTGTAGKSTTLGLIETFFDPGCYLKTIDNYNSRVGAPIQLASLAPDHQAAIVEVSQSALWMRKGPITRNLKPTISVITEIGVSQTNRMIKTSKDTAIWKSRIFDGLADDGVAVLGEHVLHFDYIFEKAKRHACRIVTFGYSDKATLKLKHVSICEDGSSVGVNVDERDYMLNLPFASQGMLHNSLAALCVAYALKMDLKIAAERMRAYYFAEEGRMEKYTVQLRSSKVDVLDDSWNATIISMLDAFSVLKIKSFSGRKIAALGRIVNLGDQAKELHVSLAEPLLRTGVDLVVTHGDEMEYLRQVLPSSILGPHFYSADHLFSFLENQVKDGDAILLKGSRRDSDFGDVSRFLKKFKLE